MSVETEEKTVGRPPKASSEGIALRSVYFPQNPPRAFVGTQTMAHATIDDGNLNGCKCTSITLIGGHTVKIVKNGKVRLVPWLKCQDAEAL